MDVLFEEAESKGEMTSHVVRSVGAVMTVAVNDCAKRDA
jgi:hypothetical protein